MWKNAEKMLKNVDRNVSAPLPRSVLALYFPFFGLPEARKKLPIA
jgi:hypothetical protein